MTALPTLDPEIADLGLALGLLKGGSGGVELDSDWFASPGPRLAGVLADDDRRHALVHFLEAMLAHGEHTERDGVTLLRLLGVRELTGESTTPDLTVHLAIDDRPTDYVEIGLAASFATTTPASTTDLVIPLYRATKANHNKPTQAFALLAGSPIRLAAALTLSETEPAIDEFGLAGVGVSIAADLTGATAPSFGVTLQGLHLPGAPASHDLTIGDGGQSIEQTLLSLVLALVRQGAEVLTGAAADEVNAVLELVGLGPSTTIPPLPVADLLTHGAGALRVWFTSVMGVESARDSWLGALASTVQGSATGGVVSIPIGAGPVAATVELKAETGPGGHLVVTPRLGLRISQDVAGAVRLGAEVVADLVTIDTATGALTAVPRVEVVVTATGNGAGDASKLLHSTDLDVGALRLGLAVVHGAPSALLELLDVDLLTHHHDVVDLSSPQAVVEAAGQVAGDLLTTLLDTLLGGLGTTATDVKALLGLVPTGGMTALDASRLLTDPLGALAGWWHDLVTNHAADVPAVLEHLRNVVASTTQALLPVKIGDPNLGPWTIPVANVLATTFAVDVALDSGHLVVEPVVSMRVDDLAGGCTVVLTELRTRLASIDLTGRHASFPLSTSLTTKLRSRGDTDARLPLGPVAIVADFVGVRASWQPGAPFAVDLVAPNLGLDTGLGTPPVPLQFPTLDANGHVNVPAESWPAVEALLGVLAANAPLDWLGDLVDLAGWSNDDTFAGVHLPLGDLVAAPAATLRAWVRALLSDAEVLGSLIAIVAHLTGGSTSGLAGAFGGAGTPDDPWTASFTASGDAPALAVWLTPDGPVRAATLVGEALTSWRPGRPGLPTDGLLRSLLDEADAGPDAAALAAGREALADGLTALVGRWVGTDGVVAPPAAAIDGVTVVTLDDVDHDALATLDPADLVDGGLPAGAVVVKVAVTTAKAPAWTPATGRLIDLTAPGLSPSSFAVADPAAGEWVVALASRADAGLGTNDDPAGLVGQSERLLHVLTTLAPAGPVVLVALGGAGHAARLAAADATSGVTHLVTLGTPWSPATFDSARTGGPGDALRVLHALLPSPDTSEPDDDDLALGRQLVGRFVAAARGDTADLEAPRPTPAARNDLTVIAVFGSLRAETVSRAVTSVFAAGLASMARARSTTAFAEPTSATGAVRIPFALVTPPGGHGVTVRGSIAVSLGQISLADGTVVARPGVAVDVEVAHTDGWLLGGPGTAPAAGALPLELRRVTARVEITGQGGPARATVTLHEGAALGADFARLHLQPPALPDGTYEALPLLPEARALLSALTTKLGAVAAGSPAAHLVTLLSALGVTDAAGALQPDALTHLLHDPAAHAQSLLGDATRRITLLAALADLVPGVSASGDVAHAVLGPLTADIDLSARTVAVQASGAEGLVHWSTGVQFSATARPSFTLVLGQPGTDAFALSVASAPGQVPPLRVELVRPIGVAPVPLYPDVDVDALTRLAMAALPAEALRVLLVAARRIDDPRLRDALDALTSALGLLKPPDAQGVRAIAAPVRLLEEPAAWFRSGVLDLTPGGALDVDRITDLLEAVKPFIGLGGTPRGTWPIVPGITLATTSGSDGPTIALAVDATAWLAAPAPIAAGVTLALTLPAAGAPRPSVELFIGVPDGPNGTTTPQHRRAAHLVVGAQTRLVLRPATGNDIELFPNPSGLGSLFKNGVTAVLPMALTQLAAMTGDEVRTEIATLVGGLGNALALSTGSPAVFDSAALQALTADPVSYLKARLAAVLDGVAPSLDALLVRVLGLGAGQHAVTVAGDGAITIVVRTVVVEVHPSPLSISATGSVTGLPFVDAVGLALTIDGIGLAGWSAGAGPAAIDVGGPTVRPFARVSSNGGWQIDVGLGLDALAPSATGHRELTARWRRSNGLAVLVTTRTGPTNVTEDTSAAALATAAIEAVLDLVGTWVLGVTDVTTLLGKSVGASTVKGLLEGVVLTTDASPTLLPGLLAGWPDKLLTLAMNLATAAPAAPIGPFTLALARSGDLLGVGLSMPPGTGLDLTTGGDTTLRLEVDPSWIDPLPAPGEAGIVLHVLTVTDGTPDTFAVTPGIAVNGVGLRLGKASGPLVDAGLRLDSVAVHLLGSVQLGVDGHAALAGGVQVELGGLAVPLGGGGGNAIAQGIVHDAGGAGSPPRPAFSPAIAIQDHGDGVGVSLRAGSGDGPWFLAIQRAFGPVYLEQVGLGVSYRPNVTPRQLEMISLYLDGTVSLVGLTASVEKLRIGYHVTRPFFSGDAWEIDLDGFAISASFGPLSLAGALVKFPLDAPLTGVEYLGMLKIRYSVYGIDLFGGYAHPTEPDGASYASFFAFGVLHAPIGGVPAFFVTGIGIGFGINRQLNAPTIEQVTTHPFMQALRASGPAPEPMKQLKDMRAIVPPQRGEFWVAAGISFTSFVLINGEILLTVQFGDGLEVAILGAARAQLPTADLTLVSIELALLARFSTKEGLLLVQAQLTDNSWLLTESVRLTGGFAFATWWKGPNAGQFVVTVGGYHPRFHHDGYPVVPRVGLRWQPFDAISVEGGVYFALCSEAIMAGAGIHAAAHLGPAHASLDLGFDGIVFFDPFFFDVSVYAEARVGITIWLLFGSVDIDVTLGFDVEVTGPPIHLKGHMSVCGVGIPFEIGEEADLLDAALDAAAFIAKYLRGDQQAQVVQAAAVRGALTAGKSDAPGSGGVAKPPDGTAERPFRLVPEFALSFVTTVPTTHLVLAGGAGGQQRDLANPGLGVAPMYSPTLDSTLTITITSVGVVDLTGAHVTLRPPAAFPKGVWAPAGNPKAKTVPAGETVDACDGYTLDTVIDDSAFPSAPLIDYHQIELPRHGRKPLPFVTNRFETDSRFTAAKALRDAAAVLVAGDPDAAVRFERTALVMAAAGRGRTSVNALRGERAAAPSFGSLADDLDLSPPASSTTVSPVVVDRRPPPPRFVPPIVKSLVGAPLAYALDRPARTTVADATGSIAAVPRRLGDVQAAHAGKAQLALHLVPRQAQAGTDTLLPVGTVPLTRLASGAVGAVANAQPGASADRLASMSAGLVRPANWSPRKGARATGPGATSDVGAGALVHDGELAVITVAHRSADGTVDTVTVSPGLTRVLFMAAGGLVLDDQLVGADGAPTTLVVPAATERIAVVGVGDTTAAGGRVPGWYAGQSLPSVGWGAAIGGGTTVIGQGQRVRDNRERADGGWVTGHEIGTAAIVRTTFRDAVNAVAVVVDDRAGLDTAARLAMTLVDAERALDGTGRPQAPRVLVDGVRTILLYAVTTTGPRPTVVVERCTAGELAGVAGGIEGVDALADALAGAGLAAAVQPPLVGGAGARVVTMVLGATPPPPAAPAPPTRPRKKPPAATKAAPSKKPATKKATPATKATTKTTATKAARRTPAPRPRRKATGR